MDTNYTTQLFTSILFFAPGALLLAGLAFVGILMAFEKLLDRGDRNVVQPQGSTADLTHTTNPAPGRLVATLKQSQVQQPAAKRQRNAKQ